jgi:hypothetical protein
MRIQLVPVGGQNALLAMHLQCILPTRHLLNTLRWQSAVKTMNTVAAEVFEMLFP